MYFSPNKDACGANIGHVTTVSTDGEREVEESNDVTIVSLMNQTIFREHAYGLVHETRPQWQIYSPPHTGVRNAWRKQYHHPLTPIYPPQLKYRMYSARRVMQDRRVWSLPLMTVAV